MILACRNETANASDLENIAANKSEKESAINFLISVGMIKLLKEDKTGKLLYKGVQVKEAKSKSSMDKDTQAVLALIEEAKNEGVWTKTLERRTDLPQKVVTRSLKQLEKQGLIKPIKSVKYPTRKMYMLFHLTPSSEVTGGVWYHEQEFDQEFVNIMLEQIYGFIASKSLPKPTPRCARPLYPRSEAHRYPSLTRIADWIRKNPISDVKLKPEDVEPLLRVLEFDGLIEKLPAGIGMAQMSSDEDDDEDDRARSSKKASKVGSKRKRSESSDEETGNKKRKRSAPASDDEDLGRQTDSDSDDERNRSKKKQKKKKREAYNSDDEDDMGIRRLAEVHISDAYVYRAIRPLEHSKSEEIETSYALGNGGDSWVSSGPLFGGAWLGGGGGHLPWADSPCTGCPQVDFCSETGPVNASECVYYTAWLDPERAVHKMRPKLEGEDSHASMAIELEV